MLMLTGINRCTCALELEFVVPELHLLQLNFPIGPAPEGDVIDGAFVSLVVNATENCLATILFRGANAERENGGIKKPLVDHIVERWCNVVDRNGVISKTQNAIKPRMKVTTARYKALKR